VANFVWSAFQIANHVETVNGTTITNGGVVYTKPCLEIAALKAHRPSRFSYNADAEPLGCGWSDALLAARMCISGAAAIVAVLSFVYCFVKRSKATYLFSLLLAAGAVGFGWLLIQDSKAVAASAKWCDGGLQGIPFGRHPTLIECKYWPFIAICIFEGVAVLTWALLAWSSTMYLCVAGPRKAGHYKGIETGRVRQESSEAVPENAFAPNTTAEAETVTPLITPSLTSRDDRSTKTKPKAAPQATGFDFESRARRVSPETAPDEAPAEDTTPKPASTTRGGGGSSAPPPPPPPSSGQFDFETMSHSANREVDFTDMSH